ncbi:uncharacterized protein A4U43_C05F10930 [Asparagus officinalis]|uniref:Ribonucleotide reductase large subunit C-terminal domain-containing protein n=1 Tax=Asparagus officinalis TaxID=4686 RepID=A0A5P1EV65_ASPOF|nr:uncharacterized protein A4U43_C05F10930 [Asparagus officinalis]
MVEEVLLDLDEEGKEMDVRQTEKINKSPDIDFMYTKALYYALPMDYMTVAKLQTKLDGEAKQNTVRKLIDKIAQDGYLKSSGSKRLVGNAELHPEVRWNDEIRKYIPMADTCTVSLEEQRAHDLFNALWIHDFFMERVQNNGEWSLFCPNEAQGLADCWGKEFNKLYTKYDREGKAKKVVQAQNLWFEVLKPKLEHHTCYISTNSLHDLHQSLNLCTEILEYTSPTETVVCNLPSIALPRFVRDKDVPIESHPSKLVGSIGSKNRYFDFYKLAEVADFGLARLAMDAANTCHNTSNGDFWLTIIIHRYLALEYASSGKLAERPGVYSFGVVLLELITGRKLMVVRFYLHVSLLRSLPQEF